MSELLKDVAAMWFQVEKHRWNTSTDFCSAARRWHGTGRGYQQRLLMEATARTQGEDELARYYITCLLVIIRKMEPIPGLETQLDMLHRNLRPGLQRLVKRADFRDIDELQKMTGEAELTLEMEKTFRPPPPPELTMLPEAAYKSRSTKPTKPTISGVDSGVQWPRRQRNLGGSADTDRNIEVRSRIKRVTEQAERSFIRPPSEKKGRSSL